MEQRRLRLGDILDDYCPRERRVTNHAVVAMIGEDVKQTRCTTCDAEHAFKGGREPKRRKKDAQAVLYREVLAGMGESELAVAGALPADAAIAVPAALVPEVEAVDAAPYEVEAADAEEDEDGDAPVQQAAVDDGADDTDSEAVEADDAQPVEEGPVHRRLIRATLPRPEGMAKEPRQEPEFTMRSNPRGNFRGGPHRGNGTGNGNGHRNGGRRFAGGGHSPSQPGRGQSGRGGGGGFRGNNAPRPGGGGKKRSR